MNHENHFFERFYIRKCFEYNLSLQKDIGVVFNMISHLYSIQDQIYGGGSMPQKKTKGSVRKNGDWKYMKEPKELNGKDAKDPSLRYGYYGKWE